MWTQILEILKYILPSLVVLAASYYVLQAMLKAEMQRKKSDVWRENQKIITPMRLQAYERMVLFLERISPEQLIIRLQKPRMTAQELHLSMIQTIRAEFDHNLSQQIYLSQDSWELVRSAKENMLKLLNTAKDKVDNKDPAMKYSRLLIDLFVEATHSPINITINRIKAEAAELYG